MTAPKDDSWKAWSARGRPALRAGEDQHERGLLTERRAWEAVASALPQRSLSDNDYADWTVVFKQLLETSLYVRRASVTGGRLGWLMHDAVVSWVRGHREESLMFVGFALALLNDLWSSAGHEASLGKVHAALVGPFRAVCERPSDARVAPQVACIGLLGLGLALNSGWVFLDQIGLSDARSTIVVPFIVEMLGASEERPGTRVIYARRERVSDGPTWEFCLGGKTGPEVTAT